MRRRGSGEGFHSHGCSRISTDFSDRPAGSYSSSSFVLESFREIEDEHDDEDELATHIDRLARTVKEYLVEQEWTGTEGTPASPAPLPATGEPLPEEAANETNSVCRPAPSGLASNAAHYFRTGGVGFPKGSDGGNDRARRSSSKSGTDRAGYRKPGFARENWGCKSRSISPSSLVPTGAARCAPDDRSPDGTASFRTICKRINPREGDPSSPAEGKRPFNNTKGPQDFAGPMECPVKRGVLGMQEPARPLVG